MTLTAVLRSVPEFELVTLNFSSTTTPKLLLDTLSHYAKVERTPNGLDMRPVMASKWLVILSVQRCGVGGEGNAERDACSCPTALLFIRVCCIPRVAPLLSAATRSTFRRWTSIRPWP